MSRLTAVASRPDVQEEELDALEASYSAQRSELVAMASAPLASLATAASPGSLAQAADADLEGAIRQLRTEPTTDAERATKFAIFEGFAQSVELVRGETFAFWDQAKEEFSAAPRAAAEAEIKGLDRADAMGVSDDAFDGAADTWFVQPMVRRVARNSVAMERALSSLKSKLEVLAQQESCPMCLEQLDPPSTTVLPCCHKCCTDCWQRWVEVRGQAVVCPLCRHADFLEFILAHR